MDLREVRRGISEKIGTVLPFGLGNREDHDPIDSQRVAQWDAFSEEAVRHCGRLAADDRLGFPLRVVRTGRFVALEGTPEPLPVPENARYEEGRLAS